MKKTDSLFSKSVSQKRSKAMRFFALIGGLLLFSQASFAAQILSGSISNGMVILKMSYQGDSKVHDFSIEMDPSCDNDGNASGRVIDSGWDDTDLGYDHIVDVFMAASVPSCASNSLVLRSDSHSILSLPLQ